MARSFRKVAISPYACVNRKSNKEWKRSINRIFRRKAKIELNTSVDIDGTILNDYFYRDRNKRTFADMWNSPSDGYHHPTFLTRQEWITNNNTGAHYYAGRFDTYDEYVIQYTKDFINK